MPKGYKDDPERLKEIIRIKLNFPEPTYAHVTAKSYSGTNIYVSPEDVDLLYKTWYLDRAGRLRRNDWDFVNKKKVNYQMHTLIAKRIWPGEEKYFIDHIDGNPSNNTRENLRKSNHSQNSVNRFVTQNSTGHVGIFKRKRPGKPFVANFRGKEKIFDTIEEARAWREEQVSNFWKVCNA